MTGCERILGRLRQGPATYLELYALGVITHSRVAELRKRGHNIECVRDGDTYTYSLLSERRGTQTHPSAQGESAGRMATGAVTPQRRPSRSESSVSAPGLRATPTQSGASAEGNDAATGAEVHPSQITLGMVA